MSSFIVFKIGFLISYTWLDAICMPKEGWGLG